MRTRAKKNSNNIKCWYKNWLSIFTAQIASYNILRGILACVSSWKNNHTKQQENKQTTSKQNNRETNNKKNGCRTASVITEIRIVYNISDVFTAINNAIPQKLTEKRFLKRNLKLRRQSRKRGYPRGICISMIGMA